MKNKFKKILLISLFLTLIFGTSFFIRNIELNTVNASTTETYWEFKDEPTFTDGTYYFNFTLMNEGKNERTCKTLSYSKYNGLQFITTGNIQNRLYENGWTAAYKYPFTVTSTLDSDTENWLKGFATEKFIVKYDLNGGTGTTPTDSNKYFIGNSVSLNNGSGISKSGYTFLGWSTNKTASTGTVNSYTISETDVVDHCITFYAIWTPIDYTITYNLNGGTNDSNNPAKYTIESETITFANPTKTGYTFSGWYTENTFSNIITTVTKGSTGDKSLYAKWTPVDYTITYNLDGGTNDSSNPAKYTIESEDITLAAPTKTGYIFDGWYTDNTFEYIKTYIYQGSTGDITLYARWVNYVYTYSLANSLWDKTVETSYNQGDIIKFDLIGISFTHYAIGANGIKAGNFGSNMPGFYTIVNTGATIELCTTPNIQVNITDVPIYTITYNLDGGTNSSNNPSKYKKSSTAITLEAPTKTGYTFIGWYDNSSFTDSAITTIAANETGDKVFYAKWLKTVYITETEQTKTYNKNNQGFNILGSDKDIGSFNIQYKLHTDNDSLYSSVTPINAGSYDVKITRSQDTTYASYSKTIENGLVINKLSLELPTTTTTYYFNNSFQTVSFNFDQSLISLSGTTTAKVAGTYDVTFSLKDKSNTNWSDNTTDDKPSTWSILAYYKIEFDYNGATGTLPTITGYYNAGTEIMLPYYFGGLTINNKSFIGWNTDKNATIGYSGIYTLKDSDYDSSINSYCFYPIFVNGIHTCDNNEYNVILNNIDLAFDDEDESTYDSNSLVSGYYYLNNDLTLGGENEDFLFIGENEVVYICLNGYVLNLNNRYIINDGTLYICDCQNNDEHIHYFKEDTNNDNSWILTEEETTHFVKGGVIYKGEVAINSSSKSTLSVENVNFISNRCAIDCSSLNNALTIKDCNFYSNWYYNGGAVKTSCNANIYDSTFKYNKANIWGGALYLSYIDDGSSYIASKILIDGCTIEENEALLGGGIFLENAILTISNTTISKNIIEIDNDSSIFGGGITMRFDEEACLTAGTYITMANGTTKLIENIKEGDYVKTLDHFTGEYVSSKVFSVYKSDYKSSYFTLNFASGNSLSIVGVHDLFNKEENKYIRITKSNYSSYIGKYFYDANNKVWDKLESVTESSDQLEFYSIYSEKHFNAIANDMLTLPDDADFEYEIFEFNSDLTINQDALNADIEKYGLLDFDDCEIIKDYNDFTNFNCQYYYIWLGKDVDGIEEIVQQYQNNVSPVLMCFGLLSSNNTLTYDTYVNENDMDTTKTWLIICDGTIINNNYKINTANNNLRTISNISFYKDGGINIKVVSTDNVDISFDETSGSIRLSDTTKNDYRKYIKNDNETYALFTRYDDTDEYYYLSVEQGYKVVYNAGSGTGTAPVDMVIYEIGETISFKTNTFTNIGYKFIGWSLNNNNDKNSVKSSYSINASDATNNIITLYAVWVEKETVSIIEDAQTYTYNSDSQVFELKGANKDIGSFTIEYFVSGSWTETAPINVESYNVKITRIEDDTYKAYSKEIANGLVINKANATITVDTQTISKTYGDTFTLPIASTNFGEVTCNTQASNLVNAGTYTVTYTVAGTSNYNGDTISITVEIGKATYNMANAKWNYTNAFTYDGSEKEVIVTGLPEGVTASYENNKATNALTYTAKAILSYDTLNYNPVAIPDLNWEILKANAVITLSSTDAITVNKGDTITLPTASSNFGEVTCNTQVSNLVNAGTYTVTYTVDGTSNYNGATKSITVKINNLEYQNEVLDNLAENEVKVESSKGLDSSINLEVTVKAVANNILNNLSTIIDYSKNLKSNERISKLYDIKLIVTEQGLRRELTKDELEDGTEFTVRIKVPTDLDGKSFKLLHVHSASDVTEVIKGTEAKVGEYILDTDGYLVTKIDKFSEFTFIYEVDEPTSKLPWWSILLIVLGSLIIIFVGLFFIWKAEYDKAIKLEEDLNERKLRFLDILYLPISKFIFKEKQKE